MAIQLKKGDRFNLKKNTGESLTHFCVGCNWGQIVKSSLFGFKKEYIDVDVDLSCVMIDADGKLCDHIYSPLYKPEVLKRFGLPPGKLQSRCGALCHTGDDLQGDAGGEDDGLDNEIITVNLTRLASNVDQIYFFLNICGEVDFSQIPYAAIRMFEGTRRTVRNVLASYNVATLSSCAGHRAMILSRLYRDGGLWKFQAIGEPTEDVFVGQTAIRIEQFSKTF